MNLQEKLKQLKSVAKKSRAEAELQKQLSGLPRAGENPRPLPARRVPYDIGEYVQGRAMSGNFGEYFIAEQSLPFGRPYGKMRIGDIAAADLISLEIVLDGAKLPDPPRLLFLDTETTGPAGEAGICAFLIGIGAIRGTEFVVRQYFLRDTAEEKAVLAALGEELAPYDGVVTYNGKTFDIPLLEARYKLARLASPFQRLTHLDLLHPARRLWKLRLESCRLTHLETQVLGIAREGDVPGSEIPALYFDYLRTGNARGLQPVFFHNALDIITLAALTVEMAGVIRAARDHAANPGAPASHSLDLLSLSRMFQRAGAADLSLSACRRAIEAGLPEALEPLALRHLAAGHKRRREFELAEQVWLRLTQHPTPVALDAYRQLAIHYEHRRRDTAKALEYTEEAMARLAAGFLPDGAAPSGALEHFTHRRNRLQKRLVRALNVRNLTKNI